jgi:tetratricopeptide (TPR) repeat protein
MRATTLGTVFLFAALPVPGQPQTCAKCHAAIAREWMASRHSRVAAAASKQNVQGDFSQGKLTLRGSTYIVEQANGSYFITDSDVTGKPVKYRADFTLGTRRIQQYLTTLPGGKIILLTPAWDILGQQWVHDLDVGNPEEASEDPIPVWNKSCYSCHANKVRKNFDVESGRYRSATQNLGIDCESCHGPAGGHLAKPAAGTIVNPAKLDPLRSTMVCAQCHSARDTYADGFQAGSDYYDFFLPVMEFRLPAAYWPDGRPQWFANDATGLWQSQCFLRGGATCITCHSGSHTPEVERMASANTVCLKCHKDAPSHTHHAANSAGSSCIECHMPPVTVGLRARMRDHSMSIPVPRNTALHEIPNACNICHQDKNQEWATRKVSEWYTDGARSQNMILRAGAFAQARERSPAAIPGLLKILAESSNGAWIRANAAGHLGNFSDDPSAYAAVLRSFSDPEPLVRATAAGAIRPRAAQREVVAPDLVTLLRDPVMTVRANAGIGLVSMGVRPFPGEDGRRFEEAKQLYRARAELNADQPQQQFAAGKFYFLSGDMEAAAAAFRAALKLDPKIPAQYLLARSLAGQGDFAASRQILKSIPRDDPQYATAQTLLAEIDAKDRGQSPGQAQFAEGQVQYQNKFYGAALKALEEALRLEPKAEWAAKAQVYRAICLAKLARTKEAEAAMLALRDSRQDVDLQLAYVELLFESGRAAEALKHVDNLIAVAPKAPLAHFWRAKLLLQFQRTGAAAAAAEEAVRLSPQFPEAHNLLIRIYQMLGRGKEAAQQAEWLRDYQRSH